MKKSSKTLLIVLLFLVTATSCGKDEPIDNGEMQWKMPSEFVQLEKGIFLVPISGGTFTFSCQNYEPFISSLIERGPYVSYEYPRLNMRSVEGEWINVKCEKKNVTVTFTPLGDDRAHEFEIVFAAKDVVFTFIFMQQEHPY